MRQIVAVVLVGAVCIVAVARANENVRVKRAWLPSLFGAQPQAVIKEAVDAVTTPEAFGRVPYYPNFYNGAHFAPLPYQYSYPYNIQQASNQLTGPVILADHRLLAPYTQINGPVPQSYRPAAPSVPVSEPATPAPHVSQPAIPAVPNMSSAELVQLAREYGVTDFSKLPSLEEVGNLLGSTTPEETIATIRDIASTEDGRNLIRSFIEGRSADNEVAASENEETVIEPAAKQNAADDLEESDTVLVEQYLSRFGAPLSPIEAGATNAIAVANDEAESTTPYPGTFSRISQWANFFNPFALRREIPIPPVATDATSQAISAATAATAATVPSTVEQSVNQQTPSLSAPVAPLHAPRLGQTYPRPVAVPYHFPAYFVANAGQAGGQWVRFGVPASGSSQQSPANQAHFNGLPNQLRLVPVSPVPQALPASSPTSTAPPTQTTGQVPSSANQTPSEVLSLSAQPDAQPLPTTTQAPAPTTTSSFTEQPIHVPDTSAQAADVHPARLNVSTSPAQQSAVTPAAQPIPTTAASQAVATQQNTQHLPSAQDSKQFVAVPSTQLIPQLPGIFPASPFQYPAQQIISLPVWRPTYPFQTPSQHIGQLPLAVGSANYGPFRNAPQLLTSYDVPALPQPVAPRALPQPSETFVHLEADLRPAESEHVVRKVDDNDQTTESGVVTEPQSQDVTESVANKGDATTTEAAVETTTDTKLESTTLANVTEAVRTTTADAEQVPASSTTTARPARKINRKRYPTKDAQSAADAVKRFQRHMSAEAQSTVRIYRATAKALDSMPFPVQQMTEDGQKEQAAKDDKQTTE